MRLEIDFDYDDDEPDVGYIGGISIIAIDLNDEPVYKHVSGSLKSRFEKLIHDLGEEIRENV